VPASRTFLEINQRKITMFVSNYEYRGLIKDKIRVKWFIQFEN